MTSFAYRTRRLAALVLLALVGAALAAAAGARENQSASAARPGAERPNARTAATAAMTTRELRRSPRLWATVNACDTADRPDQIGIRGQMPATGRRLSLYMRFQIHYLAAKDNKWHTVTQGADSGFVSVGSARRGTRDKGWLFRFAPPRDGGAHMLRGAVTFVWRDGKGRTVHRIREITEAGHPSAGADPKGFSAATCAIS